MSEQAQQAPGKVWRPNRRTLIVSVPMPRPEYLGDAEARAFVRDRLAEGVRQAYHGSHNSVTESLIEQCYRRKLEPIEVDTFEHVVYGVVLEP